MAAKSYLRGHEIYFKDGAFFYSDTDEPTVGNPRPCGHCKKPDRDDDIDACLGKLPGVMNACCGHGQQEESYIQFKHGMIVRGFKIEIEGNKNEKTIEG